jgi:tyrosyl-DNA phosphodiesterase 2
MNRDLVLARVDAGGRELVVGGTHLESYRESAGCRAEQLREVFRVLEDARDVALMGDFNFCSTWEENGALDPAFVDLWPRLRKEPGWTVDSEVNTMRGALGKKDKSVRFDRILLKSGVFRATSIELLGTAAIGKDLFPSDHFGLRARLTYS